MYNDSASLIASRFCALIPGARLLRRVRPEERERKFSEGRRDSKYLEGYHWKKM